MPSNPTLDLERLIAYFRGSAFEYLALRHPSASLTLHREPAVAAIAVIAPSVGVIGPLCGSARWGHAGDEVRCGEPLFSIRRFRSVVEVCAPASGRLARVHHDAGCFVEYGQALASIEPD